MRITIKNNKMVKFIKKHNWKIIAIYSALLALTEILLISLNMLKEFSILSNYNFIITIIRLILLYNLIFLSFNFFNFLLKKEKDSFIESLTNFNLKKLYKVTMSILFLFIIFSLTFTFALRILYPLISYFSNLYFTILILVSVLILLILGFYYLIKFIFSPWIALLDENKSFKEILEKSKQLTEKKFILTTLLFSILIMVWIFWSSFINGIIQNFSNTIENKKLFIAIYLLFAFIYYFIYNIFYYLYIQFIYEKLNK